MRYQVITALTPCQALAQALAAIGLGGLGIQIAPQTNLCLGFQGGGGYIAVNAQPGVETTVAWETREWDHAVQQCMARVHRRHPWWQRWWTRKRPAPSRPAVMHRP